MTSREEPKLAREPGAHPLIRPSWKHRLRSILTLGGPAMIFLLVCGVIVYLWLNEIHPMRFTGHANHLEAIVVTPDDGMISNVWFKLHQEVSSGAVVAEVVTTDPRTVNSRLAVMRGRMALTQLEMSPVLNQQRNSLDYAQLSIQAKRLNVEMATDKVSLDHSRLELKRHEQMFRDKLISEDVLELQKQAVLSLETAIREKKLLQGDMQSILTNLSFLAQTFVPGSENDPLKQALLVQEGQTQALQDKIRPLPLYSPMNGIISAVLHAPGENVLAGEPILKIISKSPDRIIGELPATAAVEPRVGMRVQVITRNSPRQYGWGEVMGLNPSVLTATNAAGKPSLPQLYLELSISVPPNLKLRPGQPVDLYLAPNENKSTAP